MIPTKRLPILEKDPNEEWHVGRIKKFTGSDNYTEMQYNIPICYLETLKNKLTYTNLRLLNIIIRDMSFISKNIFIESIINMDEAELNRMIKEIALSILKSENEKNSKIIEKNEQIDR